MNNDLLIFTEYFYPSLKGGGTQKSVELIVKNIALNVKYTIITSPYDLDKTRIHDSSNLYKIFRPCTILDFLKIIKLIFNSKNAYFNSFFSKKNTIFFLLFSKIFKKKIILSPRGELYYDNLNLKKKIYIIFFKLFLRNNVFFHVTSQDEKMELINILGINNSLITLIPNLVNSKITNSAKPIKKNEKFFYLSRIDKKKNLLGLLETLSKFKTNNLIKIDLYGHVHDEKYFQKCMIIINTLNKTNFKIVYKGHLPNHDIKKVIPNYLACLHPAYNENFGHTIFESISFGVPVICSKKVYFNDLEKYNCGFNIDFSNSEHFEEIIIHMLSLNHDQINKYLFNCLNYSKKIEFSINLNVKKYLELLIT
jgi:glycosyltransferase involved in cell wall biosynthesis